MCHAFKYGEHVCLIVAMLLPLRYIACLLPWMKCDDMHDRCMLGLMWISMIDVC